MWTLHLNKHTCYLIICTCCKYMLSLYHGTLKHFRFSHACDFGTGKYKIIFSPFRYCVFVFVCIQQCVFCVGGVHIGVMCLCAYSSVRFVVVVCTLE